MFALTDCGRDAFDQAYDELAADALRWIAERRRRRARARRRSPPSPAPGSPPRPSAYRAAVEAAAPEERTEALAKALTATGTLPPRAARPRSAGEQLCQHHCPVAHVAEQFPQLCEAETEVFSRLLGTHVQRLATIAHGDGVCTTFIPHGRSRPPSIHRDRPASASTAGRNPA